MHPMVASPPSWGLVVPESLRCWMDWLAVSRVELSLRGRVSFVGSDISPSLIKRTSAYIMEVDRLFPMLTVYETLIFAADFRLGRFLQLTRSSD